VVLRPEPAPEGVFASARAAEDGGLDAVWLWEDCFLSGGIATSTAVLAATGRMAVGLGLMPAPLRNAALAAMETAAVCRLFPGRFTPVFGHGVLAWMDQVGARARSETGLLREYVAAVRALLHGRTVRAHGEYVRLDGVALGHPPAAREGTAPPPVLVGARGPRTLRLAGEVADGVVLDAGTTPERVRAALAVVAEGRAAAGRSDPITAVVFLPTALQGSDLDPRSAQALLGEARRWGYADHPCAVASGGPDAVAAMALDIVAAGATTVAFQPAADDPDPVAFTGAVAERVLPLVRRR
jgi:alkanesulfonate monooxygenase SsuD/methylene tetrahydromethanopterin reductase-like flavin-dependent oxidoreductase (luciferase family)